MSESPPLEQLAEHPAYPWFVVGTVCIGAFLGQLDASIAGVVLPTLEEAFHAAVADVEWVAVAYLLVLAALVVPFGRLSDMVGRKLLYVFGFLVFVGGSALCGLAPSLTWLIAFRAFQAVGAAMLQANSVAIITAAIDRPRLGRAIGVQAAAQAIGLSVGPSVGGLLIDTLGWQWVFFIAVPFGLLGTLLGWVVLPRTTPAAVRVARRAQEHFDVAGALLLGAAVALSLLVLTFGNTWGWTSPQLGLLMVLAVVSSGAFVAAERRAPSPLVDLSLFRASRFSMGILAGLLSYAVLFGSLFLVPFYLERVLGLSAARTGLLLSPVPFAIGVMGPIAGAVTDRFGPRLPTVTGMSLTAAALLGLAVVPDVGLPGTLVTLALLGTGLGMFTPPNNSAIMASAPPHRLGTAGGILNLTRSLGTSLGVTLTGAVLTLVLATQSGQHVSSTLDATPAALQVVFHQTLLFLTVLAGIAAMCSTVRGTTEPQPEPANQAPVTESISV